MEHSERDSILYDIAPIYGSNPAPDLPPVDDASRANYYLRQVAMLRRQSASIESVFDDEIDALKQRKTGALDALATDIDRYTAKIEDWHRRELAAGRATKTITLPHGVSAIAKGRTSYKVTDEDALRAFLDELTDSEGRPWSARVFRRKEDYLVSELAKALKPKDWGEPGSDLEVVTSDGEILDEVPGLKVTATRDNWTAR